MNAIVPEKAWLKHAKTQRANIYGYNRLAKEYPRNAERYKDAARKALWRACQYLMRARIERERHAQEA